MQGENIGAYQFWEACDLGDTSVFQSSSPSLYPPTSQSSVSDQLEIINLIPVHEQTESYPSITAPQTPDNNNSNSPQTANNELRVYSRRKRPERTTEQPVPLSHDQESQLISSPTQIHSGEGTTDVEKSVPFVDDSNIPIALRKCVKTCTNHPPICKFVSYDGLSRIYQAFVSAFDSVQVSNSIQEAFKNLGWRKAVSEE